MQKLKIKAGALTHLTDARYFAAREVEWLGFNVQPGADHFVDPAKLNAIREWVAGVKTAGEFELARPEYIRDTIDHCRLDAVHLGHFVPLETALRIEHTSLIKEWIVERPFNPDALEQELNIWSAHAAYQLLNFHAADWSWSALRNNYLPILRDWCNRHTILIYMDWNVADLKDVLEMLQPEGIQVIGSSEEMTGVKSFDELDEIFDWLDEWLSNA